MNAPVSIVSMASTINVNFEFIQANVNTISNYGKPSQMSSTSCPSAHSSIKKLCVCTEVSALNSKTSNKSLN